MASRSSKRSKYFHNADGTAGNSADSGLGSSSQDVPQVPEEKSTTGKGAQRYISDVEPPFPTISVNRPIGGYHKSGLSALTDPVRLYLSKLSLFKVKKSIAYFDRRVTCIEWHPNPAHPTVVALASKGGDIIWYDYRKNPVHEGYTGEVLKENGFTNEEALPYLYGTGAGGSVTAVLLCTL